MRVARGVLRWIEEIITQQTGAPPSSVRTTYEVPGWYIGIVHQCHGNRRLRVWTFALRVWFVSDGQIAVWSRQNWWKLGPCRYCKQPVTIVPRGALRRQMEDSARTLVALMPQLLIAGSHSAMTPKRLGVARRQT